MQQLSRNELYAIASLVSATAIALYYLIAVIGWPGGDGPLLEGLRGPLLKTFGLAVIIEAVIEASRSGRVDKDERDRLVEGRSFRNAYVFLSVCVVGLLGHAALFLFVMPDALGPTDVHMFHFLVMAVLLSSSVNHASRLFFYLRG